MRARLLLIFFCCAIAICNGCSKPVGGSNPDAPICMIGLTNAGRVTLALGVKKSGEYEWLRMSEDGTTNTLRGVLSPDLNRELAASLDDPKVFYWHMGQAMYLGGEQGAHPTVIQKTLDYVSRK